MNRYAAYLAVRLQHCDVPAHLRQGLLAYLTERCPTGSFLRAVLENNLREAVWRGDPLSCAGLDRLVRFLTDHAPARSWGSPKAVRVWLSDREPVPTPFE